MASGETLVLESEIAAGLAAQDADALALAYDRYSAVTYSVLMRITRNPAVAEDLLQELFLRVWTHAAAFDSARGSLGNWIMAIARNLALDYIRSGRAKALYDIQKVREFGKPDHAEQLLEGSQLIAKLLSSLTSYERRLLHMAYFEGCSQSEIAESLRTPLGTIKSRMRSALQELRSLSQSPRQSARQKPFATTTA